MVCRKKQITNHSRPITDDSLIAFLKWRDAWRADSFAGPRVAKRGQSIRRKMTCPYFGCFSGDERESTIIEELTSAIREMGGTYVLPFRFRNAAGSRTTHHLIFVSKHVRGYEIMKDVMARESSSSDQGVPSFEYNQASHNQPFLSNFVKPLDGLATELLERFAGKRNDHGRRL
jgi:hypothetical protein